jgi:hypothetical protein
VASEDKTRNRRATSDSRKQATCRTEFNGTGAVLMWILLCSYLPIGFSSWGAHRHDEPLTACGSHRHATTALEA